MKDARWAGAVLAAFAAACGGEGGSGAGDPADVGASARDAFLPDASSPGEDATADAAVLPPVDARTADGPRVFVHLRATAESVEHPATTSGQTPSPYGGGIRSFQMLRAADDPSPVTVFDHGDGYVEVGLNDGDDTITGSAAIADLPPGRYVLGRTVWTHVRYGVAATAHYGGLAIPGRFDNVHALSDRVDLDGAVRGHGWYRYTFRTGAMEIPFEGHMDFTDSLSSGGFTVALEEGETAYYYALDLEVDPASSDVHMVMEVNVHECFRWRDEEAPGHATGTFDVTASSFEPVVQLGANGYRVLRE